MVSSKVQRFWDARSVPSLVESLQSDAIDQTVGLGELLRKAKLAAAKLNRADFASWIDAEVNGYRSRTKDEVPDYRKVPTTLQWLNPYHGWQPAGVTRTDVVGQSIAEIQRLVEGDAPFFLVPAEQDAVKSVHDAIGINVRVEWHITRAVMASIPDRVRDAVLDWALKLEQAGVVGEGLRFTQAERKAAEAVTINNVFHAPVGAVAQSGASVYRVQQSNGATPAEVADAAAHLLAALRESGGAVPNAVEAEAALSQAEGELRSGTVPFAALQRGLGVLGQAQDLAVKAPQVASALQKLGSMLGVA